MSFRVFISLTALVAAWMLVALTGCDERIAGSLRANQPPTTRIWVDTIGTSLTSQVRLHWTGDDPDGFVRGYFVSVGGPWTFTTSQESTFTIQLGGLDTLLATFRVAAADDGGNGVWDASVMAGSITFGPEPYVDADSNGAYSAGERFTDLGLVDPTPPSVVLRIRNTPPTMAFAAQTTVPAVTMPVASFLLRGSDLDGNETIVRYRIALNQPDTTGTGWVTLPGSTSLITLQGNLTAGGDTVTARVLLGSQLSDAGIDVPGLRLGTTNVLYAYCEDLSGARSRVVRMPDTTRTWTVKKPSARRRILLVNDYGVASPDPATVYDIALNAAMDGTGGTYGDYDFISLIANPVPAALHKPMLIATFRLYQSVFWYARIANLSYAQNTLPEYMATGGKVLFTTGFQNFIDPQGLPIDFMPIDSLVTSYRDSLGSVRFGFIPRVYQNSIVHSQDTTTYGHIVFDRTAIFGTYAVSPAPGQTALYRLDLPKNPPNTQEQWVGRPVVGVRSANGRLVLMTIPMHLTNSVDPVSGNRLIRFLERVLRHEFAL